MKKFFKALKALKGLIDELIRINKEKQKLTRAHEAMMLGTHEYPEDSYDDLLQEIQALKNLRNKEQETWDNFLSTV
jgi:hypothetical protein